jgi:hypothetical protein
MRNSPRITRRSNQGLVARAVQAAELVGRRVTARMCCDSKLGGCLYSFALLGKSAQDVKIS